MPYLELTMPKCDMKAKEKLVDELTKGFCQVMNYPSEIFGIHFREYETGGCAQGGKVWNGEDKPYVTMLFHGPRINRETKEKLIETLTSVFTANTEDAWNPAIIIFEHPYANIGVEGKPLTSINPALSERKHYYPLDDE